MGRLIMAMILAVGFSYGARPFATDDAGTVASGVYELEAGCNFWSDWADVGVGFKHGLSQRMDIGIGFGITITPEETERLSPLELSLKFALIPDFLAISVASEFGTSSYSLNDIASRTFGPFEIDLNLGYDASGIENEEGTITYSGAVIFTTEKFDFGAEASGDRNGFQIWLCGGRFHILENLAIDAGISGGFEEGSDLTATLGSHYEF